MLALLERGVSLAFLLTPARRMGGRPAGVSPPAGSPAFAGFREVARATQAIALRFPERSEVTLGRLSCRSVGQALIKLNRASRPLLGSESQDVAVRVFEPRAHVVALEPGDPLRVRVERLPILPRSSRRSPPTRQPSLRRRPPTNQRGGRLASVFRRGVDVDLRIASA